MFSRSKRVVEAARRARVQSGQWLEPFSTERVVDVLYPDALVTGAILPDRVQEVVSVTRDGPIILYSRALEPPDQRFVIAHAIAHLQFDDPSHFAACVGFLGDPECEGRADEFATELLVPFDRIRGLVDPLLDHESDLYLDQIDFLASRFNVPRWLIRKRVSQVTAEADASVIRLAQSA